MNAYCIQKDFTNHVDKVRDVSYKKVRLASRHGGTCIITSEWHHVRVASHHVRVASRQSDITSEWHHVRATTCRPTHMYLRLQNVAPT